MQSHTEWITSATNDTRRGVARTIGMDSGQLSREVRRGLTSDRVIEIARAYKLNVIKALVDTGHINPDEAPEVLGQQLNTALDDIVRIAHQLNQGDYGLAADSSPEEGDGNPDDYLP